MDQLHLLWEYQKADVEVDKMEAAIRRSPVRQKLMKYKEAFAEQQAAMKRIESEVANMQDRLEALKDAIRMTDEQLHSLQAKIESDPPQSAEEGPEKRLRLKRPSRKRLPKLRQKILLQNLLRRKFSLPQKIRKKLHPRKRRSRSQTTTATIPPAYWI